jgi:hypothetical protein
LNPPVYAAFVVVFVFPDTNRNGKRRRQREFFVYLLRKCTKSSARAKFGVPICAIAPRGGCRPFDHPSGALRAGQAPTARCGRALDEGAGSWHDGTGLASEKAGAAFLAIGFAEGER